MPENSPNSKFLTIMLLVYGGLLVYASLMPFNFVREFNLQKLLAHEFWDVWPFNPHHRISRSDMVSNLILYFPLGGLLAARAILQGKSQGKAIFHAILICSILSFCIEFVQSTIKSRTPSGTDWILNSISGLFGAWAGTCFGSKISQKVTVWLQQRWQKWPLDIVSILLLLLLCGDALEPFLPTISPRLIWHSLKRSHFDLVVGFAQHPWHWWLMTKVLVYFSLGLLMVFWKGSLQPRSHLIKTAFAITLFALGLEFLKLLIISRSINLANVVAASCGVFLGAGIAPVFYTHFRRTQILNLAILAISGFLLYLGWSPFNFSWDQQLLRQRLSPAFEELLPLYHYAMGAQLEHIRLFIQNIALLTILVYLLRFRFVWFEISRYRIFLAILTGLTLGLFQEGGQLFLVSRVPSMTDIFCFIIGGVIGAKVPKNDNF